jgi:hypothetical protein
MMLRFNTQVLAVGQATNSGGLAYSEQLRQLPNGYQVTISFALGQSPGCIIFIANFCTNTGQKPEA